ncbi:hypothetical protein ADIS_1649 [Lunatimonas lonarensis]|uniref:Uncharacterized protein n=1 Tax=Lunatimonas lonarensis TaxID=1232681 RepID=R7ZUB1_9BACT|nr:hypothetical protein ADIS_1649 [Lunatimonas lonarensis]
MNLEKLPVKVIPIAILHPTETVPIGNPHNGGLVVQDILEVRARLHMQGVAILPSRESRGR